MTGAGSALEAGEGEAPLAGAAREPALDIGRRIPNERMRWLMLAIQRETGSYGLPLVLRQAGLDRYVGRLPPADRRLGCLSEEYAQLIHAIRQYYGVGARGMLTRIGRECFRRERAHRPVEAWLAWLGLRLEPATVRRRATEAVSLRMARPDGSVTVEQAGDELWLIDRTGDRTLGIQCAEPCCWTAVGEISETLLWATGTDPVVDETECGASGGACCRFHIR